MLHQFKARKAKKKVYVYNNDVDCKEYLKMQLIKLPVWCMSDLYVKPSAWNVYAKHILRQKGGLSTLTRLDTKITVPEETLLLFA